MSTTGSASNVLATHDEDLVCPISDQESTLAERGLEKQIDEGGDELDDFLWTSSDHARNEVEATTKDRFGSLDLVSDGLLSDELFVNERLVHFG